MALPPAFLEELRARTPLAALIGRRVQLRKAGRNWTGCCPFHGEKTPSFHVYEQHFHCYGCGAHGDAIAFVMQSGGGGFREAVESLAAEAGLEVPKPTPQAAEAERQRVTLHDVLAQAADIFSGWLWAPGGAGALAYLRGRGLTDDTIRRFGLGWSGEGRGQLAQALGQPAPLLREAGLLRETEDGALRDMFFGRVMFPIRDRRGRVISFGGRAMGDAKPKYVNGPETPVFLKRQTLYALDIAKDAVRNQAQCMAVEGYMDVIALHQAGFPGAVAPLGTALTEDHLAALWQLDAKPVLCFDGDSAGRRAALRTLELALPLLTPERSLKVAVLPEGEDPDTMVRHGNEAFQRLLDGAQSAADALFDEMSRNVGSTPEERAGLRTRLNAAAARIADRNLASEVREHFRTRLRPPPRPQWQPGSRPGAQGRPKPVRLPPRPVLGSPHGEQLRFMVAILLRHPELLHDVEDAFAALALPPGLARLRTALVDHADSGAPLDSDALLSHLHELGLEADIAQVLTAGPTPLPACARPGTQPAEAEAGWWHLFGLLNRTRLEEEMIAARQHLATQTDTAAQRRLVALRQALDNLASTDPAEA